MILLMHIFLWKKILILPQNPFISNDFEASNFTAANITAANTEYDNASGEKKLVFKDNASFIECISKTSGVSTDNAEDLDVLMPMYNLLEYCKIYSDTIGSVWTYHRDE